jgi:hypothetical protein
MEGRLRANMLWDSIVRYITERGALGSKTGYPRLPTRRETSSPGNRPWCVARGGMQDAVPLVRAAQNTVQGVLVADTPGVCGHARRELACESASAFSPSPAEQVERGPGKAHLQDNIEYLYTSLKSLYRCRARS